MGEKPHYLLFLEFLVKLTALLYQGLFLKLVESDVRLFCCNI